MRCAKPSRFIQRWIDATQSAARTGEPSWNFRLSRRRKRHVRPPSSIAWLSAICGFGVRLPSQPYSVSQIM